MQNRRDFLRRATAVAVATTIPAPAKGTGTIGLGPGNYGLKAFPIGEDIKFIAKDGYDSVELTLMPGYATEPAKVSPEVRRKIRAALAEYDMALPSLLEQIPILGDATAHKANLERIRRDAQFGHDVNAGVGGVVPCVQTHIGGVSEDWEAQKNLVAGRLREWGELRYSGYVGVEVSAMIHRKPGDEPVPTARACYERLAPVFQKAGISRPQNKRRV